MNLTPKQLKILQLIRDSRVTCGYSPTMQELADELGISKVTVFEHVEALIKKGALQREPNKARSLSICDETVVPDESSPLSFPLVGRIAAGLPIEGELRGGRRAGLRPRWARRLGRHLPELLDAVARCVGVPAGLSSQSGSVRVAGVSSGPEFSQSGGVRSGTGSLALG